MGSNAIIPVKIREEAKNLYFKYWSTKEIADFLQQNYETVRKWVTRYDWYKEREAQVNEEVTELANRRSHQMNRVMTDGLETIAQAVQKSKEGGVTMEDAERISKMLANIDKLYRLQTGKPTEIKEERKYTVNKDIQSKEDMIKAIQEDPFIEANFKDVTDRKSVV